MEYIDFGNYVFCTNRIAYWLLTHNNPNKPFKTRDLYGYENHAMTKQEVADTIMERGREVIFDNKAFIICEFVECAIFDNKDLSFLPAYVTCSDGKTKIYKDDFIDMANRVSAYEVKNGKSPNIVYIKNPDPQREPEPQKSRSEKILDEFEKYFGKCEYIDDALAKIRNHKYAFYFSDGYNMYETIRRMANYQGANCFDAAEVFYHLAKGMNTKYGRNYEVWYLDVWCPVSGYDHIRLRLRSNGGSYFYRDPACVLDGGDITDNWCGTSDNILSVNPDWIYNGD